uniref:Peroxisomal ATPase PEX6 n=1 Tax=Inonotus obliquus TaxID=167356 RepID=A0A345BJX2_9AGAM|nr:AAA protein [Inonotus obliquus]
MTRLASSSLPSIQASLSLLDTLSSHEVVVAQDVWEFLLFSASLETSQSSSVDRLVVSLAIHNSSPLVHQCILSSHLAWARPSLSSNHSLAPGTVAISRRLKATSNEAEALSCSVSAVSPVRLAQVSAIISGDDVLAPEELVRIERVLHSGVHLFGTGDILCSVCLEDAQSCDSHPRSRQLHIAGTDPVSQGYCTGGKTRLLLVLQDSSERILHSPEIVEETSSEASSSDGDFTINENFFANSVLQKLEPVPAGSSPQIMPKEDGLQTAGPKSLSVRRLPRCSTRHFDESYSLFVTTEDLGRLGIFSGDWASSILVIAPVLMLTVQQCTVSSCKGYSRLVQVIGFAAPNRMSVYGSPQLLYNSGVKRMQGDNTLSIHASPFGSGPPPIPVARSVTLARVASPLSQDKAYYTTMLRSLRRKLEDTKCLVKKGDIVTVDICIDNPWGLPECDDESMLEELDESLRKRIISRKGHISDVVHFFVSNIEHDVAKPDSLDLRSDGISRSSAFGELGCWIDPSSTRVVQTGLEQLLSPPEEPDLLTSRSEIDASSYKEHFSKLFELISAVLEDKAAELGLEVTVLLKGPTGPVMRAVVEAVAAHLGYHVEETSAYDILGETEAKTEATLRELFDFVAACSPCILFLSDIDGWMGVTQGDVNKGESIGSRFQAWRLTISSEPSIVRVFHECVDKLRTSWKQSGYPVLVVATTSNADRLSASMLSCFKHELEFEVPDESKRLALLESLLDAGSLSADVSLKELSVGTAAFTDNDLIDLVYQMRLSATERALNSVPEESLESVKSIHDGGIILNADDFDKAIDKARTAFSQNIGAPLIPSVSWDDVGGLAQVKQDILDTVQLPLENPSLFADGLKQRSGTGKTLVAKAVATSCSLNFLSVKGPELLNMYIGESEANVRRVFQQAREAKPCVIFFDELDSIAPKRGNHGDSGGVMDRIVSQLLAELDGMSSSKVGADVFVIGATNRPDLLDSALLRPGRFDRLLYLGVSDTHEAQSSILEALTRKFRLDPQLNLRDIAERCPFNYTGADFYALCSDAMLKAMVRKAQSVEATLDRINRERSIPNQHYPLTPQYYLSEMASSSETDVVVSLEDFGDALRELVPSVSQAEMDHYREIQKRFSQGFENHPTNA